jgi:hypothetical protein
VRELPLSMSDTISQRPSGFLRGVRVNLPMSGSDHPYVVDSYIRLGLPVRRTQAEVAPDVA